MMHLTKGKKIFIYFFLLILVTSTNNTKLNNLKFYYVNKINVTGLGEVEKSIFLNKLESLNIQNIFFLDTIKISEIINENSLIENYEVFRKYPSTLEFEIKKTKFLARVNRNGKTFLIGSNGKLIKNNNSNKQLPYIFGDVDIVNFLNLKKTIDQSKFSFEDIKNFYFYPSKRWDLELKNNIYLKLPKYNLINALNNAFQFLNEENFNNKKLIDLRIESQIITNG